MRVESNGCKGRRFNMGFVQIVLFTHGTGNVKVSPDGELYLKSIGALWFELLPATVRVHSGPYIWYFGHIYKVWRLYPDPNGAFVQPVILSSNNVDTYVVK